jgi:hypothetical protein
VTLHSFTYGSVAATDQESIPFGEVIGAGYTPISSDAWLSHPHLRIRQGPLHRPAYHWHMATARLGSATH